MTGIADYDPGRQSGFTLLEILVGLVLLSLIVLGLNQTMWFGLHAWVFQTRLIDESASIEGAERVWRGLVAEADPGAFSEPARLRGDAHTVTFPTRLPMSSQVLPTSDVNVALGVDAQHRLVLRWVSAPHAQPLTNLPANETVLLDGVDHLELNYRAPQQLGGGWSTSWSAGVLPAAISVMIVFSRADARHWPTIIAAPMLTRREPYRP